MEEKNEKRVEAFALAKVPKEERKSWMAMVMVQAGMVICIPAFLLGSMLAEGMSTVNAIIAGTAGYMMVLLLTFILGMQGADLGIPTCAISLSTFGRKGTRLLVSSLFTISLVGFFGLQVNVCGDAFSTLMKAAFDISIPVQASSIFWGIVMVIIAVWGMEALKNLDTASVPLLLGIMVLGTYLAFRMYGTQGMIDNDVQEQTMSMISGVGLSFSFFSASAFSAADLTRFQRDRRDTIRSSVWGLMPAGIITCVIGVMLARIAGIYDISLVMAAVGLPILGLTIMILSTLTTNSVNAYCGGLDAVMTFNLPDNRRREATAVIGILGVVLAVMGILNFIGTFLDWISFFGAPIAGVMIADYWIVGKGRPASWHPGEDWNWTGIAATVVSLGIAMVIPFGVFNANGVVIAFIVYLVLERFFPSKSRTMDGPYSEEDAELTEAERAEVKADLTADAAEI